jgi:hypothetical protein
VSDGRKIFQARGTMWCKPCAQLYMDSPYGKDPITGYDVSVSLSNFTKLMKDPAYRLICMTEDGVLKAFLLCRVGLLNFHSCVRGIVQEYYVTSEEGFKAARILKEMHERMVELGIDARASVAVSHCSHLDVNQVLCKILHKAGWERAGHYVYRRLTEPAPARTQVVSGCNPRLQLGSPSGCLDAAPPTGR